LHSVTPTGLFVFIVVIILLKIKIIKKEKFIKFDI